LTGKHHRETIGRFFWEGQAPQRKRTTTWSTFLKAHWSQLSAIDVTTLEVWTKNGLVTHYLLFAMRLATRQVCFLGCTPNPGGPWMRQRARNLTDAFDGFVRAPVRYVLMDRARNSRRSSRPF
jgi:putative transposase